MIAKEVVDILLNPFPDEKRRRLWAARARTHGWTTNTKLRTD